MISRATSVCLLPASIMVGVIALTGCNALVSPKYTAPQTGELARLDSVVDSEKGFAYTSICNEGHWKALNEIGDGRTIGGINSGIPRIPLRRVTDVIPAGVPLKIGAQHIFQTGQGTGVVTTHKCEIALSFLPVVGQRYDAVWTEDSETKVCAFRIFQVTERDGKDVRSIEPSAVKADPKCVSPP